MKQGILLVNKPVDWTSFDVVNYVRKIVASVENKRPKNVKVGHSGTLDPFATGLLILLVGKEYTRRASEFTKQTKVYDFTLNLGQTSTTGDLTGELTVASDGVPTQESIELVLKNFIGEIDQVPPAYSAIKIDGQRAYKLAREGAVVTLAPRKVTVYSLNLIDYNYPHLKLVAKVSSGTYIRSLGEDIGIELKTGAYVSQLNRELIGDFKLSNAVSVDILGQDNLEQFIMTDSKSTE